MRNKQNITHQDAQMGVFFMEGVTRMDEKQTRKLKKQLTEEEAKKNLRRTTDGRIVKGGDYFGESYGGTAKINK
jgi:hypothetical protein